AQNPAADNPAAQSSTPPAPGAAEPSTSQLQPVPATSGTPGASSNGQQSSTQEDDTVTTIIKPVNEVNVVFTVTDKHGRYVKDLKKEDFKVVDDAKPAAEIKDFRNQT